MNRIKLRFVLTLLLLGLLCACSRHVTVQNNTDRRIRTVITSYDYRQVISPPPGQSSTVEVGVQDYRATVISNADWVGYTKLTRKVLDDRFAKAEYLSDDQLRNVVGRVYGISWAIWQLEQAADSHKQCEGVVRMNHRALVTVSAASDGSLVVTCKSD